MHNFNVTKTKKSRLEDVDFENIPFGRIFADHMFIIDFEDGEWKNGRIQPYGPIPLSPALSCMHYGQAIFEGMKAFRSHDDRIFLFRPLDNHKRLNASAERMCMPQLPEALFMEALELWLSIDSDWIPGSDGSALYIRPFMIATDDYLGVKPSSKYSFMIYGCPVNSYYTSHLKIRIEEKYVRAVRGGVGYAKAAGNYAAAMYPASLAQKEGYHQLLWTDAIEHKYLEELGTSNFFAIINGRIITPELSGTILHGITRDSVIALARELGTTVEERPFPVTELIEAAENGTLTEAFATGTAATLARIEVINYQGRDYTLDVDKHHYALELSEHLDHIKNGRIPDIFGWIKEVESQSVEA